MSQFIPAIQYDKITQQKLSLRKQALDKFRTGVRELGFEGDELARIFHREDEGATTTVAMMFSGLCSWYFYILHELKDVYITNDNHPVEAIGKKLRGMMEWIR